MSRPIEDYALLGNLHTAALVGRNGSIDWLCLPRFDSPACLAALLGDEENGCWVLAPSAGGECVSRGYRDEALVLDTVWETETGSVVVTDFMPPDGDTTQVVRIVEGRRGRVEMHTDLRLRFDYGQLRPWVTASDDGLVALAGPDAVLIHSDVPLRQRPSGLRATFEVRAGERVAFVLSHRSSHRARPERIDPEQALRDTLASWTAWLEQCCYQGRWEREVRSALVLLRALTYAPTGAIVAAATTSLPEEIGGVRNWDYRYCWLRDATFALRALVATGYLAEAQAWREWLLRAAAGDPSRLQIVYQLDGYRRMPETTVDGLAGYAGSAPVRIGNAAAGQLQLDVWGEVLSAMHLARETGLHTSAAAWDLQRGLLDWLEGSWREPDNGLWEIRARPRHHVHSKVMAWAGFDRAVKAVEWQGLDGPVERWRAVRDDIAHEVLTRGYDAERRTFTQSYGSQELDAALLLLPRIGFLDWSDPRIVGTVEAIRRELDRDGLLMRYGNAPDGSADGVAGGEGAFLACSFWLADALHAIGRHDEAVALFERLLSLRNDVGLLSEEYDVVGRRQLGNTPQAFSLVGIISTAHHLTDTLLNAPDSRPGTQVPPARR